MLWPLLLAFAALTLPFVLDAALVNVPAWHVLRRIMWGAIGAVILGWVVWMAWHGFESQSTVRWWEWLGLLPAGLLYYWLVAGAFRRARLRHPPGAEEVRPAPPGV